MSITSEQSTIPQFAHSVRGYDRFQVDEYIERLNEWAAGAHARAAEAERLAQHREREVLALQARVRDLEAERPQVPEQAIKAAAERAADAVGQALRQADQLRRRAAEEAERRLDDAARQATDIIETARASIEGLTEESLRERQEGRARVDALIAGAEEKAAEIMRRASAEAEAMMLDARARVSEAIADGQAEADLARQRSAEEHRQLEESLQRLQVERSQIVGDLGRLRGAIQALIASSPAGPDLEVTRQLEQLPPGPPNAGGGPQEPPEG